MLRINTPPRIGPTIALCVIAKNEADMIGECIDSAREFVDEIVVVDTGSTDRTIEIAQEHGARVEHFAWINDFGAARNYAIEVATTDWILMLDADERLERDSGPFLKQAAGAPPPGYFGYCVQIENLVQQNRMAHYMTRLFPRHPEVRFHGSIHEEVKSGSQALGLAVMELPMVHVIHHGYQPEVYAARNKDARNMGLLLAELDKHPDDARLLFYVMQQHCAMRRYADAVPYAERFLPNKSQLRHAFEVEVIRMWLEALDALERFDELDRVLRMAEADNVLSGYAYEMLGTHQMIRGRLSKALEYLLRARDETLPKGLWARPTTQRWELRTRIADCRWELGEYKRALAELEQALADVPADRRRELSLTVIRQCLKVELFAAAYRWSLRAHEFSTNLHEHLEVVDLVGVLPTRTARSGNFAAMDRALSGRDWQVAYDEGVRLRLEDLAAAARIIRLSGHLVNEGAPDAALDVLERALDAYPREPQVYWTLATALNSLGRHSEAADALSVIESLESAGVPLLRAA